MANNHRGEVEFEALGESWRIKLGTNAMAEAESRTGLGINAIASALDDPGQFSITMLRTVMLCGMVGFHKDITAETVGDIIDNLGVGAAADVLASALVFATPEGKAGANPRKARAKPKAVA